MTLNRASMVKWLCRFLFVVTAVSAMPAAAQTVPLYLAHLNENKATENPTGAMAVRFESRLAELTGGRLRVETFPDGQLGPETQVVELVRRGTIQSAIVSVGGISDRYPPIGVLNYPFRFRDLKEAYRVFDGPFGRMLGQDIEKKLDLAVLGYGDTGGLFVLTNSRRPVRNPADLAALRIRTMSLKSHQTLIQSLGAEPVTIGWSELYTALRNGTVIGQMNPPSIILAGQLYRVQKYLTVTNHLYTPYIWIANPAFLEKLSAADRDAVAKAAHAGVQASRELAASQRPLDELNGSMVIYHPTDAELKAFRDATQPEMERFLRDTLGDAALPLLKAFRDSQ